jgi:AraC-like DNA-binding protein
MQNLQITEDYKAEIAYQPPLIDKKLYPMIPRIALVKAEKAYSQLCKPIYVNGYVVLRGEASIQVNNEQKKCTSGDVFFNKIGDQLLIDTRGPLEYFWFNITGKDIDNYLEEAGLAPNERLVGNVPEVSNFCSKIFTEYREGVLNRLHKCSLFWQFLKIIEDHLSTKTPCRIKKVIDQEFTNCVNIDYLAKVIGISKSYLQIEFKRMYGITPKKYIRNRRLEYGANLLRFSNFSVREISELCGFETCETFIRCFKVKMGKPPIQWRKGLKN